MRKELVGTAVWAIVMLGLAVGATLARKLGYIDSETVVRLVTGVFGLWMVWYGNRIPKRIAPNACARQAQRVAAWSMILSGIVYAALWTFAPIPVAAWGGTAAVFAGVAITFGYCLSLQSRAKAG